MKKTEKNDSCITHIYGSRPFEGRLLSFKNIGRFLVLGLVLLSNINHARFIPEKSVHRSPFTFYRNTHAFHTSITEMRYNPKDKAFEVSLRVFTDDLEKTLSTINQNKKFVIDNNDKSDVFIEPYIRKHFIITSPKNQKLNYQYVGKEKEGDATWIYLEMPVNEPLKGSKIQNDVLIDMFDDQTNIVNIFLNNEKKSYLFTVKNKIFMVEI